MDAWIAELKSTLPSDSDDAREQVYGVLSRLEQGDASVAPSGVSLSDATVALSQLMCELAGEAYQDYVRQVDEKSGGSASHASFIERELRPLEFRVGDHATLTLLQRPIVQASDLGNAVWEGAVQLARLIERRVQAGTLQLRQMRVLEIGAGVGLVGLALAALGAQRVVLTDMRNIVPLLQRNAELNAAVCGGAVEVRDLDWTDDPLPDLGTFDLIVAADCIYVHSPLDALVSVLERYSIPQTTILFTYEKHDPISAERFLALAGARHFRVDYLSVADEQQKVNTIQLHRESSPA